MRGICAKIVCILLAFMLCMPALSLADTNEQTSSVSAIALLDDLGFLPESYNLNSKISREKFIVFLVDVMGLSDTVSGKALPFTDVVSGSETYNAVSVAYDLGIINGNGSSFSPKESVTYNQALKMLVSALGYGVIAEAKGGYPFGYVTVANQTGLTDGIIHDGDKPLNGETVAVLMYNTLNAPVLQTDSVGDGSVSYTDANGKTFLETYHGIVRIEGQLRGTQYVVISGNYELDADQIIIGNTIYKTNGTNYDSFAGYSVCAYYSKAASKVVAMEKDVAFNETAVVSADEIIDFANGYLIYDTGSTEKKIQVRADADITYNGRPVVSATRDLFDLNDGDVTFIDSDSSGTYDTILISDFDNYVVASVDSSDKIICDLYDKTKVLSVGDAEEIFVDDFGNTMYYEELRKYDVISVWKSTDGKNIKMRYSNKEIRGTITEKGSDGYGYVVVDGEIIKFAKSFMNEGAALKLGTKGVFILDMSGKIAAFKTSDEAFEYAYLIQAGMGNGAFDKKIMIRVVKPDGSIVILDCDEEKLKIDGYTKTPQEAKAYFNKSQLIRYTTGNDGKVIMIDTAATGTGDEDTLTLMHTAYNADYTVNDAERLRYSKGAKLFSGKVAVTSSTPMFNVPAPTGVEDDRNYYITNCDIYTSATHVPFEAYTNKAGSFTADVLINYQLSGKGASIPTKTPITIVDEVRAVTDSEGNETYKLSCWYNGSAYREYLFEDDEMYRGITDSEGNPHTLVKGDIVRLNVNTQNGIIKRIDLVYDRVGKVLTNGATIGTTEYFLSERFVKGRVYEKEDNFISLTQETDISQEVPLTDAQKEIHILYPGNIFVYDSTRRKGTLTKGSVTDVHDFVSFDSNCSEVVIFTVDGGDTSIVVVYK